MTKLILRALAICLALTACAAERQPTTSTSAKAIEAETAPCVSTQEGVCREVLTLEAGAKLAYYRTFSLGAVNSRVTRAVIVVHGTDRKPLAAFSQMLSAARATNNLQSTIIVAPHF